MPKAKATKKLTPQARLIAFKEKLMNLRDELDEEIDPDMGIMSSINVTLSDIDAVLDDLED